MLAAEITHAQIALQAYISNAGDFIRAEFSRFDPSHLEKKGRKDLVSYVDRNAEEILVNGCHKIIPEAKIITEEGHGIDKESDWCWIIDPLDGTTNFVHGLPIFAITVALQYKGDTVLGTVYDIMADDLFSAVKGQGATRNGKSIAVSKTTQLVDAILATGFPYENNDSLHDYLGILKDFAIEARAIRRLGSAALDLCWVACGRFDGFYELGLREWDVAGGALIVQEAGGVVSDFKGTDKFTFGRQIAAASPALHPELLSVIGRNF